MYWTLLSKIYSYKSMEQEIAAIYGYYQKYLFRYF